MSIDSLQTPLFQRQLKLSTEKQVTPILINQIPSDTKTKELFKQELISCLLKTRLGKILSRETGREFIFTRSQFIAWYKKHKKDNGQSFLKELEANNLTEDYKQFAKNNLTTALAILFGQEKKIETSPKKLKVLDLAEGDVFVYRFDNNGFGRWVGICDAIRRMPDDT